MTAMLGSRGSTAHVATCSYSNATNASLSGALKNRASLSKKSYLAPLALPSQNGEFPSCVCIFRVILSYFDSMHFCFPTLFPPPFHNLNSKSQPLFTSLTFLLILPSLAILQLPPSIRQDLYVHSLLHQPPRLHPLPMLMPSPPMPPPPHPPTNPVQNAFASW